MQEQGLLAPLHQAVVPEHISRLHLHQAQQIRLWGGFACVFSEGALGGILWGWNLDISRMLSNWYILILDKLSA